jgi:hypothetical protein
MSEDLGLIVDQEMISIRERIPEFKHRDYPSTWQKYKNSPVMAGMFWQQAPYYILGITAASAMWYFGIEYLPSVDYSDSITAWIYEKGKPMWEFLGVVASSVIVANLGHKVAENANPPGRKGKGKKHERIDPKASFQNKIKSRYETFMFKVKRLPNNDAIEHVDEAISLNPSNTHAQLIKCYEKYKLAKKSESDIEPFINQAMVCIESQQHRDIGSKFRYWFSNSSVIRGIRNGLLEDKKIDPSNALTEIMQMTCYHMTGSYDLVFEIAEKIGTKKKSIAHTKSGNSLIDQEMAEFMATTMQLIAPSSFNYVQAGEMISNWFWEQYYGHVKYSGVQPKQGFDSKNNVFIPKTINDRVHIIPKEYITDHAAEGEKILTRKIKEACLEFKHWSTYDIISTSRLVTEDDAWDISILKWLRGKTLYKKINDGDKDAIYYGKDALKFGCYLQAKIDPNDEELNAVKNLRMIDRVQYIIDTEKPPKLREILTSERIKLVFAPIIDSYSGLPKRIDFDNHTMNNLISGVISYMLDNELRHLDYIVGDMNKNLTFYPYLPEMRKPNDLNDSEYRDTVEDAVRFYNLHTKDKVKSMDKLFNGLMHNIIDNALKYYSPFTMRSMTKTREILIAWIPQIIEMVKVNYNSKYQSFKDSYQEMKVIVNELKNT